MPTPRHPAKFSKPVLTAIRKILVPEAIAVGHIKVLDPFAGVGGVHELAEQSVSTLGLELQPEWASAHEDTRVGDVLAMPADWRGFFDVLVTSPCYGNRMADHHAAADPCRACDGSGVGDYLDRVPCTTCKGTGLTRRNTYAHALRESGAEPVEGSAAMMQWGPEYRAFHEAAWRACKTVLRPGALAVINVSNHIRDGREQRVVEFHLNTWMLLGVTVQEVRRVQTQRNGQGANRDSRVEGEVVMALRLPS